MSERLTAARRAGLPSAAKLYESIVEKARDPELEALVRQFLTEVVQSRTAELHRTMELLRRNTGLLEALAELSPEHPEPQRATSRPIEEILAELATELPEEEWDKLPADLSDNIDHYVYGTPKR